MTSTSTTFRMHTFESHARLTEGIALSPKEDLHELVGRGGYSRYPQTQSVHIENVCRTDFYHKTLRSVKLRHFRYSFAKNGYTYISSQTERRLFRSCCEDYISQVYILCK